MAARRQFCPVTTKLEEADLFTFNHDDDLKISPRLAVC